MYFTSIKETDVNSKREKILKVNNLILYGTTVKEVARINTLYNSKNPYTQVSKVV